MPDRSNHRRTLGLLTLAWASASLVLLPAVARADEDLELLEQQAFRAAVERVAPSVVRIETVGGLERVSDVLFGTGPTTGLVVDSEGYIVSSAFNFVNKPTSILVRLGDGTRKPAQLVATDHNRMVALLKIEVDDPLPVPEIAPVDEMRVGQWAIAVGRTFEGGQPNMAVGIISALGRVWGKAIQTDAAVSPNNYGGPLIDLQGRVLGVLVPLSPQAANEVAGVEWYDSGIGFAVEAEHLQKVLPRLKKGEDLRSGVIGIGFAGQNLAIVEPKITSCRPGSPAAEAGLKKDDRIIEIDGRKTPRAAHVKQQLARHYAGEKVHVVVLRDEQRIEADVELVAKLEPFRHGFLGVLPKRDDPQGGVTVRYVYPDSPAAGAGIQPGDVLEKLGGEPITGRSELIDRIGAFQPEDEVQLQIRHGGALRTVKVILDGLPEDVPKDKIPPARAELAPGDTKRTDVGTIELKIPEMENDAWAYVPEGYDPAVPHGVVVWLHAPGDFDWDASLARWKDHCQRHDLILLAPEASDAERWKPTEAVLVKKLLDQLDSDYTVDRTRVVLHGYQGGGTMACIVGFGNRELVRAVAPVEARIAGRLPENDPQNRMAIYLGESSKSDHARGNQRIVDRLREIGVPITVKDLGEVARYLNDDELTELVRWIDTLDRI